MSVKMITVRYKELKLLRGKMTQAQLAKKAGVARITVIRIESGEAESVTFATINRLAKALNVDADMLVGFK